MKKLKDFGNWFNKQTTGEKIAMIGLVLTAISSIILPVILYFFSPSRTASTSPVPVSNINSPNIQQAPNSKSEITYNTTNNNVTNGADPRDVEIYLKKLKSTSKTERYKEIDTLYQTKQINSGLKDTLYTVIDYIEQNLQSSNRQINQLQLEGKTQTASTLVNINTAFAASDINKLSAISNNTGNDLDINDPAIYLNIADKFMAVLRYSDAEVNYQKAITLLEKQGMQNSPDYASALNFLAKLYVTELKYDQALKLYERSSMIFSKTLGKEDLSYAVNLNDLANLYNKQGKYDLAEPAYKEALEIRKKSSGINNPGYAQSLNDLANLYSKQYNYESAESMYKQALDIYKNTKGKNSSEYAITLNDLALIYDIQGNYGLAEPLYKESLRIIEATLGKNHPTAITINNNYLEFQKAKQML